MLRRSGRVGALASCVAALAMLFGCNGEPIRDPTPDEPTPPPIVDWPPQVPEAAR